MRHLAKTLYYWLATTEKTSASAGILSCSDNAIALSRSSALQIGEIFVHVQQEQLCKSSDCSVLFREILGEDEEGVFPTRPATFSQVFPPETFDAELADVSIESVLPPCADMEEEDEIGIATTAREEENVELSVLAARRSLQAPAAAPAAAPVEDPSTVPASATISARSAPEDASIARGRDKYEDDEYYYDDDKYYYDDDRYHPQVEQEEPPKKRQFLDAVKKLLYDLYCIIRNLQCEEWNPGQDDAAAAATAAPTTDGTSKDDKDDRRLSSSTPMRKKKRGGVRGLQADISFSDTDITTGSSSSSTVPSTVTINTPDGGSVTTTSGGGYDGSSTTQTAAAEEGKSKSKDDEDDEEQEAETAATDDVSGDDDFFDDDLAAADGGNFRAFIDTIFEFGRTVWCIFRPCYDDTTTTTTTNNGQANNGYDDDHYNKGDSKDKEKHVRWLRYAP